MINGNLGRALLICALVGALGACRGDGDDGVDGSDGRSGTDGRSALLVIGAEPAGANCASGGSRINSGLDTNANDVLDASEITGTQYVCNGGVAIESLVELHDEAAGANCPDGGKRFSGGLDANDNNVLDAAEVTSSGYICNGGTGDSGTNSLTAIVAEAAGANCAAGGVRITSGPDVDGDGALDAGEVNTTQFVCNGAAATNSLLGTDAEAAGANCEYGGTRISAGLDTNGNGTLDAGEVTTTTYACDGAPGPGITWQDVTGTSVQAVGNRGYLASNDSAEVTITLPATATVGQIVQVSGRGLGGWKIAQNPGQSVVTRHLPGEVAAIWTPRAHVTHWSALASSADGSRLVAGTIGDLLYTSNDAGVTWIPHESVRIWTAVASSADGMRLVAGGNLTQLMISDDGGATWTPQENLRYWAAAASSADGRRLVAVATGGRIYTSDDAGVTWTPREFNREWYAVASSADGMRLAAAPYDGQIHVSDDAGVTWTARGSPRGWRSIAASADGTRLVAAEYNGRLYTSTDAGVTWTARESSRLWRSVASSADGLRLAAAAQGGQLYTSADAGVTWLPRESNQLWSSIASSADGTRLVAGIGGNGQLYTTAPATRETTTVGAAGSISGDQYDAISLQYLGVNQFAVTGFAGVFTVR